MVLVGPSGCGKSTLLRLIAGLEDVDAGEIWIGERDVTDLQPRERDIAMVFQSYALYPHMSVRAEPRLRPQGAPAREEGGRRAGRASRPAAAARRAARAAAGGALGRPAAARGDGPRDRARAAGVPDGRAALQPRREAPRRDAGRAREPARAARRHDRVRHARPGRGDDARATGRGDARRAHPAGRHAEGALRAAGQRLRRVVHRLAGDESRRGPARRRPRSSSAATGSRSHPSTCRRRRASRSCSGSGPSRSRTRRFADPSLPQLDVEVAVLEDLGSDAHVLFPVDATPVHTEELRRDSEEETLIAGDGAVFTARVDAATRARPGAPHATRGRPGRLPLLRS